MKLRSDNVPEHWGPASKLYYKLAHLVDEDSRPYLNYFLYLASGGSNRLVRKSFASLIASVDQKAASQNVVWETPNGTHVLSRQKLREIGEQITRVQAGREVPPLCVGEVVARANTAKKIDYPKDFKEALRWLDKEIKRLQKEMFEGAPLEQVYYEAYENLMDITPDFAAVWDRFTLAKGLVNKGWNIRAGVEPAPATKESRNTYHDMALDLQGRLGQALGRYSFQEMSEQERGVVSLFYTNASGEDASGDGVEFQLWYTPWDPTASDADLGIRVLHGGKLIAQFSEHNEHLFEDLMHRVAEDAHSRWTADKTAAQLPMMDEVDTSLPKALLPDRSGWHQVGHQTFLALRDFLRHNVAFYNPKMHLLWEKWNGDVLEYTMRGDRENIAVYVQGSIELEEDPMFSLEVTYEKDGKGWTTVAQFPAGQYEKVSDLVSEVQTRLSSDLEKGLRRLDESPSTADAILQRALTPDLLR